MYDIVLTSEEKSFLNKALDRFFQKMNPDFEWGEAEYIFRLCHNNHTKLDLFKLSNADEFTLVHDIKGIVENFEIVNGCTLNGFSPICKKKELL